MPREGTHWAVLEGALQQLLSDGTAPAVTAAIQSNRGASYLGAIYQDIPYYLEGDSEFEKIADHLHGVWRTDTFDPGRSLTRELLKQGEKTSVDL